MQRHEDLREKILSRLNEALLPALRVHRKAVDQSPAPPAPPAEWAERLQSSAFQSNLTHLISEEMDAFFTSRRPEELFQSQVSAMLPKETLAKLQKIVAEEAAGNLMSQLDERFKNLVKRINLVPETLKPGWLARALSAISEELTKNLPDLSEREKVRAALAEIKILPSSQTKIKPEALAELKREIAASVLGSLRLAAQPPRFVIEQPGSAQPRSERVAAAATDPRDYQEDEALDLLLMTKLADQLSVDLHKILSEIEAERPVLAPVEQPRPAVQIAPAQPTVTPASATREAPFKSAAIRPLRPRVLVVHCIDPRFQQPIRDFLFHHLKLEDDRFVHLAVPGGVLGLALENYLPKFHWALRKWIGFAADIFPLERVVCIGHHDCRTYQTPRFMPMKPGYHRLSERERQIRDMKDSLATLKELLPKASVELFYLDVDEQMVPKSESIKITD